ncbi:MAG TPA: hypothetical protein ENH89_22030 [Aurantimonas coralicida]|uniref:Uncharacterized protein n=1 Tax=Aurantimonas coralicida TaxID=182270 RepID=A0A9C9TJK3_9HYPH|nr:hypothetical protein [Aurantimonas coralicida]
MLPDFAFCEAIEGGVVAYLVTDRGVLAHRAATVHLALTWLWHRADRGIKYAAPGRWGALRLRFLAGEAPALQLQPLDRDHGSRRAAALPLE